MYAAGGAAQAESWTGVYGSVGGGFAMANHELDFSNGPLVPPPPGFNVNLDGLGGEGGFFTVGVGADYQLNSRLVIGAFFDYDWLDVNTEISAALTGFGGSAGASAEFGIEDQWFIGGRFGYLASPGTLLFVSAGYTEVSVSDMTFNVSATGLGSINGVLASVDDLSGYFIGGGAEIRLTGALTVKGEYRYTNLDAEDVTLLPTLAPAINGLVSTKLDPTIQTARLSLNYRLGLDHSGSGADAEVAYVPQGSWTGIYAGIGGGFAMANHELDFRNGPLAPPPPAFNVNLDGLGGDGSLLTLAVGADYQIHPMFLVGAFFDYDVMDVETEISGSLTGFGGTAKASAKIGVDDQWSIGGRIGYLPSPNTLLFASLGYTEVSVSDMTFTASATGLGSISGVLASVGDLSGYFIGGGAEIRLTDALSLKGEYRYTYLDAEPVTLLPTLAPGINDFVSTELDPSIQSARLSLNYRFNWDRPAAEVLK